MATNTAGTSAQLYNVNLVHYLALPFTYLNPGVNTLGTIPAGACVLRGGVVVEEAFAGGTPQTFDLGVTGNADDFASDGVLTTVGVIAAEDMATATSAYATADIDVILTLSAGATPSAGIGYAWVEYVIGDRTP